MVNWLCRAGAEPAARSVKGLTPLLLLQARLRVWGEGWP